MKICLRQYPRRGVPSPARSSAVRLRILLSGASLRRPGPERSRRRTSGPGRLIFERARGGLICATCTRERVGAGSATRPGGSKTRLHKETCLHERPFLARVIHDGRRKTRLAAGAFAPPSLGDRAAGNTISGVSGRIGLHIIRFGVNYQGSAAVAEHRVIVIPQIGIGI